MASKYARWQESARKDTEGAFGELQWKFHVLVPKMEFWYLINTFSVVNTCIILHNMMVLQIVLKVATMNPMPFICMIPLLMAMPQQLKKQNKNMQIEEWQRWSYKSHEHLYGINSENLSTCMESIQMKDCVDAMRMKRMQQFLNFLEIPTCSAPVGVFRQRKRAPSIARCNIGSDQPQVVVATKAGTG
jgi:hypothetical protein